MAVEVKSKAWNAWGAWLFATSIIETPKVAAVGFDAKLPGDIRLTAPPQLLKTGIEDVVIRFADKPSDPKLGPILLQLQERFRTHLEDLLRAQIDNWEERLVEERATSNALSGKALSRDLQDRRAQVDVFILRCRRETPLAIKRKHIWLAAGHATPRQFQYWQAGQNRQPGKTRGATEADNQNFRRILRMQPAEFVGLLKKEGLV